jgi:RNA polymerase primary sigma factor
LRWVRQIARRYAWSQLPFADLIQEGNLGLITAAEKFDERMGHQFSTYAFWWIRQSITRAIIEQSDVIRLPVHIGEFRSQILRAMEELSDEEGHRIPTPEAIAAHMNVPVDEVKKVQNAMRLQTPTSLHAAIKGDQHHGGDLTELQEMIVDTNAIDPETTLAAKQELEQMAGDLQIILGVIRELPGDKKRNLTIFKNMHGLNDAGEKNTLEEVGQEFGVTRERIRQILMRIFGQLAERGIEVDQAALKEHLWRIHELEKLCGVEFKMGE